jgi:creatine kinase
MNLENKIIYNELPIFTPDHSSLMVKYLNELLFDKLKHVKSIHGFTFSDLIKVGVINKKFKIGVVAGDENCYEVFDDLIYQIIKEYHNYDINIIYNHNDLDISKIIFPNSYKELFNEYIISTRIRTCRNISNFLLTPNMSKEERKDVENIFKKVFDNLNEQNSDFSGEYHTLEKIINECEKYNDSTTKGLIFQIPFGNLLLSCGSANDYPNNRGVYINHLKNISIWINEEDHCRIMCVENNSDIIATFNKFTSLLNSVEKSINNLNHKFMMNDKYGYLTTCPSNIGTGIRASFMINLSNFNKHENLLETICSKLDLQVRGSNGEHSKINNGIYDISNKHRIGYSEVELIQKLIDGTFKIITLEKLLENNTPEYILNLV